MRRRTHWAGAVFIVVALISAAIVAVATIAAAITPPRDPDPTWQTVGEFERNGKNPTGRVWAIQYGHGASAGKVFVAGNFTEVKPPLGQPGGQVTRLGLMALDVASGDLITSFSPDFTLTDGTAQVRSLALSPDGSKLYVGGLFTHVDGLSRPRLAEIDTTTGAVGAWKPNPFAAVNALELNSDGTVLYAGGHFKKVKGIERNLIAAFDMTNNGSLMQNWHPQITQVMPLDCPGRCWPTVLGLDLSPDESTLYISGSFAWVDGIPRNNVAAVSATTGAVRPFDPNVLTLGFAPSMNIISEIAATDERVYFCGDFWALGTGPDRHPSPNLAGVDPITGRYDASWVATTDGGTNDCAVVGDALVVGGHFEYAGGEHAGPAPDGTGVYRQHVAAISLSDGSVQSWNPNANSASGLYAIGSSPTKLGIGGDFLKINFQDQAGFGQFSLGSDTVAPTRPGKPSGVSNSPSTIDLTWAASSDNLASNLTYRVYRDGGPSPVGTVSSSSTTTVEFTDGGLDAGSVHTYTVTASDGENTSTPSQASNPITVQSGGSPQQACGVSNGVSICLNAPSDTLTGDQLISVTVDGDPGFIYAMDFSWGPTADTHDNLLYDFEAPWEFVWKTDQYWDATKWLNVRVEVPAGTQGQPISLQLTTENGNDTGVPQNPNDWASLFSPRSGPAGDPQVVAIGDSADGGSRSDNLAASVAASDAEVLLYLGDMYERGTAAEWDYNYGRASFDDPGGGWKWGALAGWTQPTLGNHEAHHTDVYRNYWHGRPDWTTFVHGGVRYLNLNSECSQVGGCDEASAQYAFVEQTLAANSHACVVAMWHKPVLSAVQDNTAMRPIWSLLADNGGDLVLGGHTHDMEIYGPLDADLNAGQADSTMWQIVSGAGGHDLIDTLDTDPRNIWQKTKTTGALYMTNVGGDAGPATAIDFVFRDVNGATVFSGGEPGSGTIDCGEGGGPGDTVPPTVPGQPSGSSDVPGEISLSWAASSDDQATSLTYFVYRDWDPNPVGSVTSSSTTTVDFTDTDLVGGATHTYQVAASDGTNLSFKSVASDPITVMSGGGEPVVFADDFDAGNFAKWTWVAGVTIDNGNGADSGPPSARAAATGNRHYLRAGLGGTYDSACAATSINLASGSGYISLIRLRTTTNVGIGRVYVNLTTNELWVRSDVAGTNQRTNTTLSRGTWHDLELCIDTGTAGVYDVSLDGVSILTWAANAGTNPIGMLQIGDSANKTYTANFDDVLVVEP